VEAKGLGESLDDKKFMAQAINYANNDGVLWCVLTNGIRWSVYKTNEPVAMDRKFAARSRPRRREGLCV
jgi:predicted type IV restriction endonuclease